MDDWESMMENDVEVKVEGLIDEEFSVKKQDEEIVYQATSNSTPAVSNKTKNLNKKLKQGEIDKKFQSQNNAVNETFGMADPKRKGELLAYQQRLEAQRLAEESDQKITQDLFSSMQVSANVVIGNVELKSKSDYQYFGKHLASILNKEERKSYVEACVTEIISNLSYNLSSKELQEVQDVVKITLNAKIAEDKAKDLGKKKVSKGPVVKMTNTTKYDDDDEDYGYDDDDYVDDDLAQYLKQ